MDELKSITIEKGQQQNELESEAQSQADIELTKLQKKT